ncbi:CTP:phosphoglutamine cytidylyltransferase [Sinobacterium norvegicum]|uniref:CTP:phosphoglutamine cytidylyltransferase n=1 Tax=Sinobacterium norvegicum TaxID=1641715 RepID=A0ABM9AFN1_9GAMM|nr:phosphocholine cytidylyltransferase family protein [Sinobacterium norvegicum]CAH0992013.1 CTP:phosphoglutamine cytidylyltransferase [Sinobacterium norvegicum]
MTRALILAAGQGTRLRPLTNDKPKCLVPLLGKTLLARQVDTLRQAGIDNIHIATGYRCDQIEALGFNTTKNPRFAETNMVETLFCAKDFIQQEGDLIIAYGDIVYNPENLQALLASDAEVALMIDKRWRDLWSLRLENPLEDAETLVLDEHSNVIELGKKPENYDRIHGQYTGLIKLRSDKIPAFIEHYNKLDRAGQYDGNDFDNMYMTSFIQGLIDNSWQVKAAIVNNGWLEIDSTDDLAQYENMASDGTLALFYRA